MEFIDVYDAVGKKVGIEEKYAAHRKGLIHKAVCVWIMNSNNEVLLQKRASHVMFPNLLDISYSGHIQSGENSIDAVLREGKEELGIEIDLSNLQYLFSCRVYGKFDEYLENEIDDVFIYQADIPKEKFSFCDSEVQGVEYIPVDDLKAMVDHNEASLVPYELHYRYFLMALESRLLAK